MKAETQIQISPEIEYIDFDSDPKAGRYVFTYTITIVNQGPAEESGADRALSAPDSSAVTGSLPMRMARSRKSGGKV